MQHCQIVLIGLHRKRFELPLPDMAAAFVVMMVCLNQPIHS